MSEFYFKDHKGKLYGPYKTITDALLSYLEVKCGKADLYEKTNGVLRRIDFME
jgi:hypothetical protein